MWYIPCNDDMPISPRTLKETNHEIHKYDHQF